MLRSWITNYTADMSDTINANLGTRTETAGDQTMPSKSQMDSLPLSASAFTQDFSDSPKVDDLTSVLPKECLVPRHQDLSNGPCQCLETVGKLTVSLEMKTLEVDTAALDSKLASQRESLNKCNTVLGCKNCSTRPEYLLLLGLLTQNLTNFCEATVNLYLDQVREYSMSLGAAHSPAPSESSSGGRLGHYAVESSQEWSTLMKVLIILQLQSVQTLLRGLKGASYLESNPTLPRMEWPCPSERRVLALIKKLGHGV